METVNSVPLLTTQEPYREPDKVCHMDDMRSQRIAIAVAPLIFIAFLAVLVRIRPDAYGALIKEDGVVEYGTCCAYLGAAVFAFLASRRSISGGATDYGIALLAFAGVLLVVAMEEISWGQRLFGFSTPVLIAEHNAQGEMSLHNLGGFQQTVLHPAYMLVGFAASVGSLLIPGFIKHRLPAHWRSLIPSPHLFFYFFPTFAFYFSNELIHPYTRNGVLDWLRGLIGTTGYSNVGDTSWVHQEPVEFMLSAGFLLLTLQILSSAPTSDESLVERRTIRDGWPSRPTSAHGHSRKSENIARTARGRMHLPVDKI